MKRLNLALNAHPSVLLRTDARIGNVTIKFFGPWQLNHGKKVLSSLLRCQMFNLSFFRCFHIRLCDSVYSCDIVWCFNYRFENVDSYSTVYEILVNKKKLYLLFPPLNLIWIKLWDQSLVWASLFLCFYYKVGFGILDI